MRYPMVHIFSGIVRFFSAQSESTAADSVARQLMESAQLRAGSHPYQAEELRSAAQAYLSVVR